MSHPVRGRRSKFLHPPEEYFLLHCNHTPQGDVGLDEGLHLFVPGGKRYTPQGDVGLLTILFKRKSYIANHTPQGDVGFAETTWGATQRVYITPRKGTQAAAPLYCTVLCGKAGRLLFCEILGCARFFPQFFQLREFPQFLYWNTGCFPLEDLPKKRSKFLCLRRFSLSDPVL